MFKDVYAVVLCGGSGTRLWPVSRKNLPKQFLSFEPSGKSLLVQTVERLEKFIPKANRIIVTGRDHENEARKQVEHMVTHFIVEPAARNTAAAICMAAKHLIEINPNAIMVVLPSDHYIESAHLFEKTILNAIVFARSQSFVTVGVKPTFAATSFGYIELGEKTSPDKNFLMKLDIKTEISGFKVNSFHEKPAVATAQEYLKSGQYLWNAGMFVWNALAFWNAFGEIQPGMKHTIESINEDNIEDLYPALDNVSIDVAFLEKTKNIICVPAQFLWNDLGSWSAIKECFGQDPAKSSIDENVFLHEAQNSFVQTSGPFVSVIGLDDIIVVATKDAVLVAHASKDQEVKKIISFLESKRSDLL